MIHFRQYLLVILAWHTFAGAIECPYELLLADVSEPTRSQIDKAIKEVGTDERRAANFLSKYGTMKRFTFPGQIDHISPVDVLTPISDQNIGNRNHAIMLYQPNGEPRAVKLIAKAPLQAELDMLVKEKQAIPIDNPTRLTLIRFIRELEGSAMGQAEGAPVIKNFGRITYGLHDYLFIEMEELFPEQNKITVKEAVRIVNPSFNPFLLSNSKSGERVTQQIARKFVGAVRNNYNPNDADFMISKAGEVRWIDTTNWTRSEWKNPQQPEYSRGSAGRSLADFLKLISEKYPAAAQEISKNIIKEVNGATDLTTAQKQRLMQELFGHSH